MYNIQKRFNKKTIFQKKKNKNIEIQMKRQIKRKIFKTKK